MMVLLMMLPSCTNDSRSADGEMLPEGKYPLVISSISIEGESIERPWGAVPKIVEDTNDGKSSVWEWNGSEMIGVKLGNETAIYTLNTDGKLIADNQLYWKSTSPAAITAWYPTSATVDLSDQSGGLAYVLQASEENASYNDAISLQFKHQLAKVRVELSGTQAGQVLRLKGKGIPDVNGYGRGDILAVVDIAVPSKLSADEKRLMEQLSAMPSFSKAENKKQNIFDKMRSFFRA